MIDVVYNFDGGGGTNGGPCGWGWVRNDGASGCGALQPGSTSNEAEYVALTQAVHDAMIVARDYNSSTFTFLGDSKLVVEQVTGNWQVHANKLRPYVRNVQMLLDGLPSWELRWIPRKQNSKADEMAWAGKAMWVPGYTVRQEETFSRGWDVVV